MTAVAEISDNHPALRAMVRSLAEEASAADARDVSDTFVMDIMERILSAETVEDAFAAQESGMVSGKDFSGRPFWVKSDDISIRESSKDAFPFFAIMKVREVATGEEYVVNCGGKTFMAMLQAARTKGYFDATDELPLGRSMVIVATPTGEDNVYLSLKPFRIVPAAAQKPSGKKA